MHTFSIVTITHVVKWTPNKMLLEFQKVTEQHVNVKFREKSAPWGRPSLKGS